MGAPGWGTLAEELAADVRRVSDRLRGLSQARLAAPVPPHDSAAAAARMVAQVLADAAAGLSQRDLAEPTWRVLPVLSDFAAGDQVSVVGHDLLAELPGCPPAAEVWARSDGAPRADPPAGRRTAVDVVTAAAAALAATRRSL